MVIFPAIVTVTWCRAGEETAETVLARAQAAYGGSEGVTVQAYQREVWLSLRELQPGQAGVGPPNSYRVIILKKKSPDDWYAAGWSFIKYTGKAAMNNPQMPRPSGFLMVKMGVAAGKLISFGNSGNRSAEQNILTDDEFEHTLRSRVLVFNGGFAALAPLLDASSKNETTRFLGLRDARMVASETWKGHAVYRVEGSGPDGGPFIAWIDQQSGAVVRTVGQQGRSAGFYRTMIETIYETNLGAKLGAFDFDAQVPAAAADPMTDDQMGFERVEDLKQYAGSAENNQPELSRRPSSPVTAPVMAPPVAAEQQVLSADQMAGIVLIDGDEGTATGFMAKIRGVDFVVTNEHVLGENKKITLKNLRGETIPVLAVYGAVGSDVAILRIGKAEGGLKLAEDVLTSVKIGDKVVVVGNRLGGGVATQISGQVLGVGPTRVEVNANFEPGNSGSPIFSTVSNEVIGVATYAETRKVAVEEGTSSARSSGGDATAQTKVEKRWFGYRLDGIAKWEAIDMARWRSQGERIDKFRDLSEALVSVIRLDFKAAAENDRLAPIIADFESHAEQMKRDRVGVAGAVKDMMRTMRNIAEAGINDFSSGDYYDYYRTCLYWEESVPMQVDYRRAIVDVLKKYEANSTAYVSRMRNGGGN